MLVCGKIGIFDGIDGKKSDESKEFMLCHY